MLDGLKRFKEFLRQNQNVISYMNEIFAKDKQNITMRFLCFPIKTKSFTQQSISICMKRIILLKELKTILKQISEMI